MPRKIILDCDPGIDDAVAMFLAHGNPEIEVLAYTTVAGNHTLDTVTRNARILADLAGIKGVPIAAGCAKPLLEPLRIADYVHGDTGLGPMELPDHIHTPLDPRHAVNVIIDTIMSQEPKTVTLVPLGPLTNIAMAVRMEPRIVERVQEVVLMGGNCATAEIGPIADFNVGTDPEAAHIVFNEKWPLTMMGVNLTCQARMTPDAETRILAVGTKLSQFTVDTLKYYGKGQTWKGSPYTVVHDPCAVAYVIDKLTVKTRRAPLNVELSGALTRGMTVADARFAPPDDCETQFGVELDFDRFWTLIVDALKRIGDPY